MSMRERCPVCGMQVGADAPSLEYLGMRFAFCSAQCEERFRSNPHLYVGGPGIKAPVQEGQVSRKRRRLRTAQPLSAAQGERIQAALLEMMGMEAVRVRPEEGTVEITYDLLQCTEAQIERTLEEIGIRLGGGWGEALRRAFVHYLEETELDSREVRPGAPGRGHHH